MLVARQRRLAMTVAKLWQHNQYDLRELVTPVTLAERELVEKARAERKAYLINDQKPTMTMLKNRLKEVGLTSHGGITRGGLIDLLIENSDKVGGGKFSLDPDQTVAVSKWNEPSLLINAGPGAGKTTVVCHLTAECVAHDDKVLLLVYNREAERTLTKRLRQLNVQLIQKNKIDEPGIVGCSVMTFDKFAYQINTRMSRKNADDDEDDDNYDNDDYACYDEEMGPDEPANVLSKDDSVGDSYFIEMNRAAMNISADGSATESLPKWSVIVVDEAQDVTSVHRRLIDGVVRLNPSIRKIIAGDPRQELYSGTGWFSESWATTSDDSRVVLRYNHRSSPEIVEAINIYSRNAFPSLHHEQISAVDVADQETGVFLHEVPCNDDRWWLNKTELVNTSQQVGTVVGSLLASKEPGTVYAVAPVTIEKYNMQIATTTARQTVEDERPGEILHMAHMLEKSALQDKVYIVATSRKIKGTERDSVVVYGADVEYSIETSSLSKMLFVALSRAQKTLHIVTRKLTGQKVGRLLRPVIEHLGGVRVTDIVTPKTPVRNTVPVADTGATGDAVGSYGICYSDALRPVVSARRATDPVDIETRGDNDFVGCFAEALVAEALGVDLSRDVELVVESDRNRRGICYDPIAHKYQIRIPSVTEAYEEIATVKRVAEKEYLAYEYARMKFSVLCGKLWTVSRHAVEDPARYKDMQTQTAAFAETLFECVRVWSRQDASVGAGLSRTELVEYANMFEHELLTERSDKEAGGIIYVPDLIVMGIPVEIKYTDETTANHRRQAGIYATLRNAPYAVLANMKVGALEKIEPLNVFVVEAVGRAILAVTAGRDALVRLEARAIRAPRRLTPACVVTVDVEKSATGSITEIGAVAFSATDNSIIDTYRGLADGVEVIVKGDEKPAVQTGVGWAWGEEKIQQLTGLRVVNLGKIVAASKRLITWFKRWVATLPEPRTFVYWGGSESELLSDVPGETCDAYQELFKPWLDHCDRMRTGACQLTDAARQIVPTFKFTPHRAYEDALATASVFIGVTSFTGVV